MNAFMARSSRPVRLGVTHCPRAGYLDPAAERLHAILFGSFFVVLLSAVTDIAIAALDPRIKLAA